MTDFTHCPGVSIVNFEQVNADWDNTIFFKEIYATYFLEKVVLRVLHSMKPIIVPSLNINYLLRFFKYNEQMFQLLLDHQQRSQDHPQLSRHY